MKKDGACRWSEVILGGASPESWTLNQEGTFHSDAVLRPPDPTTEAKRLWQRLRLQQRRFCGWRKHASTVGTSEKMTPLTPIARISPLQRAHYLRFDIESPRPAEMRDVLGGRASSCGLSAVKKWL